MRGDKSGGDAPGEADGVEGAVPRLAVAVSLALAPLDSKPMRLTLSVGLCAVTSGYTVVEAAW